jgi:cell division topological specificity factor
MTVIDFLNRLLGRQKPSGTLARERLQLVLAHDRSDLNPELLEQMRREILEVVQRYVEIDIDSCDVSLETEDRVTALLANLPIRRARPVPLPRPDEPGAPAEGMESPPAADATPAAEESDNADDPDDGCQEQEPGIAPGNEITTAGEAEAGEPTAS